MREFDLKLMRYTLAIIWVAAGALSLGIFPQRESLILLEQAGLHGRTALIALYGSAIFDIIFGVLTLTHPSTMLWRCRQC